VKFKDGTTCRFPKRYLQSDKMKRGAIRNSTRNRAKLSFKSLEDFHVGDKVLCTQDLTNKLRSRTRKKGSLGSVMARIELKNGKQKLKILWDDGEYENIKKKLLKDGTIKKLTGKEYHKLAEPGLKDSNSNLNFRRLIQSNIPGVSPVMVDMMHEINEQRAAYGEPPLEF